MRVIDADISEKVFNLPVFRNVKGGWSVGKPEWYDSCGESLLLNPLPEYSTSIQDSFLVVDKLKEHLSEVTLTYYDNEWVVYGLWVADSEPLGCDKELPMAICKAALRVFN